LQTAGGDTAVVSTSTVTDVTLLGVTLLLTAVALLVLSANDTAVTADNVVNGF